MINITPLLRDLPMCVHEVLAKHHRLKTSDISAKKDNSYVTTVDIAMEHAIKRLLLTHFPSFDSWGEESFENEKNINNTALTETYWVIDPIDGTTNFIHNIPSFCTMLSLIVEGEVVAGIVYDPNRQEMFHALKSKGVFLNEEKILPRKNPPKELKKSILAVDFKRLDQDIKKRVIVEQPYHSQRNFGSSGIELAWLGVNRVDVYLNGPQRLWDYSCGLLFMQELGGVITDLQGKKLNNPLTLNKRSVLACQSAHLHQQWLSFLP